MALLLDGGVSSGDEHEEQEITTPSPDRVSLDLPGRPASEGSVGEISKPSSPSSRTRPADRSEPGVTVYPASSMIQVLPYLGTSTPRLQSETQPLSGLYDVIHESRRSAIASSGAGEAAEADTPVFDFRQPSPDDIASYRLKLQITYGKNDGEKLTDEGSSSASVRPSIHSLGRFFGSLLETLDERETEWDGMCIYVCVCVCFRFCVDRNRPSDLE